NGVGTWLLSPLNLVADLLSLANPGVHKLEDMPAEHRREIETCVREFVANGDRVKAHMAEKMKQNKRGMRRFKWSDVQQDTELRIPAFERDFRYIQTIAVSAFNTRESTSRHFGPLRLTFRVLYNLAPADSKEVFIEVDGRRHYWVDNPLFIFDDTMFHRSVNDVDGVRYCLFMDIVRPNYSRIAFNVAVSVVSVIAGSFKRVFYQTWSFMRCRARYRARPPRDQRDSPIILGPAGAGGRSGAFPAPAISLMSGRREARANGDHHRQGAAGRGSVARSRRDRRFRRRLARARGRGAGRRRAVELSARLLQHPADRSRRGALRAGVQADGGERRLRRYPVPGRGALQEAGRRLLAAGGGREVGARARVRPRARDDLALPGTLADRRYRSGVADVLDGARLRPAASRGAGRHDD